MNIFVVHISRVSYYFTISDANILLSNLSPNIFNIISALRVRDLVTHTYKTRDKITVFIF
jgi:hypothetical protein